MNFRNRNYGIVLALCAIAAALTVSGGAEVFAKTTAPKITPPKITPTSSTSVSSAGDNTSKRHGGGGGGGCGHACPPPSRPGHTQPTCRGGHMGPNGVMVQCD